MSQTLTHHPVFSKFKFSEHEQQEGFRVNGLGVRERKAFYDDNALHVWKHRCSTIPVFDEEYFEWIDLLEAVDSARDKFTIIELGAGYGPWVVNAVTALRQKGDIPFKIIAVEADSEHFEFLKQHLSDNNIDPEKQTLLEVAVTAEGGQVTFEGGDPQNWYGQSINRNKLSPLELGKSMLGEVLPAVRKLAPKQHRYITVKAITLGSILDDLDHVDLIDMDIQGEEANVVAASIAQMTQKIKRVHIGTHARDIEDRIRQAFNAHGWENVHDLCCFEKHDTKYGVIDFNDGVQSWVNPNLSA